LRVLDLSSNQLGSGEWPTVLRTIDPSDRCDLSDNGQTFLGGFTCDNVGAGTSCCTVDNCRDTSTCYQG